MRRRLTCRQDGDCCPSLCTCDTPYNAASFDRLKAHQPACTHRGCPKAKCKDPGHSLAPVCVEGLCTSKKVPYPAE